MASRQPISVGVPVWQGADFVAETLASIERQRGVDLAVLISIDGGDERSEQACRPFLADPRFTLIRQPRRIGWVRNSGVVLSAALARNAAYACIQPHDDLMQPDYLAALLDAAEDHPQAAVVYSDMEAFGTMAGIVHQPSVTGPVCERLITVLAEHYNAISYRGLTRGSALSRVPMISGNTCGDFAVDSVWMARLAGVGELVRVPQVLYRKRYHEASTHGQWTGWSIDQRLHAWIMHCVDMVAEALRPAEGRAACRQLLAAARARLLLERAPLGPYQREIAAMAPAARAAMSARFDAAVSASGY